MKTNFLKHLNKDFPASIVVFLVALPLCLGIAQASEAPLFSGLIAGIVGGIIVSAFSGSSLGVSGPAAGLIAIVIASIASLGSYEAFLLAVVLAGVIQLILGFIKAGIIGYYFPSSVIKGMLSGIGVVIIFKQLPHLVGYDKDPEGDFAFAQKDDHNTISEIFYAFNDFNMSAIVVTIIAIAILILWESKAIKNNKILSKIQGPLLVVVVGIVLTNIFAGMEGWAFGEKHLVRIPVAKDFTEFTGFFTTPDFSAFTNPLVYKVAFTIAIVASLETLLCLEATDKLDPEKRISPPNRELVAQGVGNMISGLIGGLPITQVIVRSSANIQSGGKTKASAFIHGIFLLGTAYAIPTLLNQIPSASLACILLIVGFKLAKPSIFRDAYAKGVEQFVPFIVTIIGIVFTDLLTGIGLGLVVAIFFILWKNYRVPYHVDLSNYKAGEPIIIELSEDVSFLNKVSILQTLEKIPREAKVLIDGSKSKSIHPDIIEIIDDFKEKAEAKSIELKIQGFSDEKKVLNTPNLVKKFDNI